MHIETPASTIVVVPREAHTPWPGMLATLVANTEPPYRLVVVDGGSPHRVARAVEELATRHDFTLVRRDALLTSNEARNLGMRHVETEFVVFVDNDTLVPPGWLTTLEQAARETDAPLIAPVVLAGAPGAWEIHAGGGEAHIEGDGPSRRFVEINARMHHPPGELDGAAREPSEFVELHCLLARTALLEQAGQFDEGLIAGREHSDLTLRIGRLTASTPLLEPAVTVKYASYKRLSAHDWAFFLPRWSEEWAGTTFAHFNEQWELRDTRVDDDWFQRGNLARRLHDRVRPRTGARLRGWRAVRRVRRALDRVATPAALAMAERSRTRCGPARIVHPRVMVHHMTHDAPRRAPRTLLLSRQLAHPPRTGGGLREMNIIRAPRGDRAHVRVRAGRGGPCARGSRARRMGRVRGSGGGVDGTRTRPPDRAAERRVALSRRRLGDHRSRARRRASSNSRPTSSSCVATRSRRTCPSSARAASVWCSTATTRSPTRSRSMGAQDTNRARGMTWRRASRLIAQIEAETIGLVDQIWVAHSESQDCLRATYPDAAADRDHAERRRRRLVPAVGSCAPRAHRLHRALRLLAQRRRRRHARARRAPPARARDASPSSA